MGSICRAPWAVCPKNRRHRIVSNADGINIRISGMNDKIDLVLREIILKMANFELTESEFNAFKNIFLDDWRSELLAVERYGINLLASIFWKDVTPLTEKHAALREITLSEFMDFSTNFFKNCWTQALMQGNFSQVEAMEMFIDSLETLNISENYNYNYDITAHHSACNQTEQFKFYRPEELLKMVLANWKAFDTRGSKVSSLLTPKFPW